MRAPTGPGRAVMSLVVLRWVRSRRTGALTTAAIATVIAASSIASALLIADRGLGELLLAQAALVTTGIVMSITLGAALLAVIAGCAGADLTPAHRSLLVLPVSTRTLNLSLAAPGLLLSLLVTALSFPALTVALTDLTGYGSAHAVAVLTLSAVIGTLAGRLIVVTVRVLTARNGWAVQNLTTICAGSWIIVAVASGALIRAKVQSGTTAELAVTADALTGWPALLSLTLRPHLGAWAGAVTVVAVLAVAVWLSAAARAGAGITAAPHARAHLHWNAGQLAQPRLAAHRLLRHRRTQTWLLTNAAILLALSILLTRLSPLTLDGVHANVLLLTAQLAAYPALLARGLDRRDMPVPVRMGVDPVQYALSWQVAGTALALAMAAVPLTVLTVLLGRIDLLVAGTAMILAAAALAGALSALLVVRPADSGAEITAGALLLVGMIASGLLASKVLGTTELLPVAAAQLVLFAPTALLPAALERRRMQLAVSARTVGQPGAASDDDSANRQLGPVSTCSEPTPPSHR